MDRLDASTEKEVKRLFSCADDIKNIEDDIDYKVNTSKDISNWGVIKNYFEMAKILNNTIKLYNNTIANFISSVHIISGTYDKEFRNGLMLYDEINKLMTKLIDMANTNTSLCKEYICGENNGLSFYGFSSDVSYSCNEICVKIFDILTKNYSEKHDFRNVKGLPTYEDCYLEWAPSED